MKNSEIKSSLKLAGQLMELHGANPFKTRSYSSAADIVGGVEVEFSDMAENEIIEVEGIGKGMAANIKQLLTTGSFDGLKELLDQTPDGVVQMLDISGFGPKKVAVLWKEGGVETLEELLDLCFQGKVATLKGFAEKSQDTLLSAVQFLIGNRTKEKFANVHEVAEELEKKIQTFDVISSCSVTGQIRRKMEVVDQIELLVSSMDFEKTRTKISQIEGLKVEEVKSGPLTWFGKLAKVKPPVKIHFCHPEQFVTRLIETTGSMVHLNRTVSDQMTLSKSLKGSFESEEKFYQSLGMEFIVPELREGRKEIEWARGGHLPKLIEMSDLKGILHNHSTYSDGKHTLRKMAEHCKELGYEYLGISDHSQTAVYANGLKDFQVKQQQEEITLLNQELAPFKIFSGIESDILNDGSLDYSDDILASFDFIVASVHSGLNMDMNKATDRLLQAIHNPYTTILGHMTGRLLVQREGYPVDHERIIDACADQGVVIEINASPYRLDMDWRWIQYAIEKGVMLSINPDAHKMEGYQDMFYGVQVARKGGLTPEHNLNSMGLEEIQKFLKEKRNRSR